MPTQYKQRISIMNVTATIINNRSNDLELEKNFAPDLLSSNKDKLDSVIKQNFITHDNTELFYRYWPANGKPKGAIILFHRGHEHSGRLSHIVDELNLYNYDCFAWDARGHGHSPGERGFSPSMATSVRDIQSFIKHISTRYGFKEQDMAIIAQSVGAVLVSAWVHDYAPKIRCMILAAPAFKVKLYIPFARTGIKIMHKLGGNFFVNSYVKAKYLTHDQQRIQSFETDPLISRAISSNILLSLYDTAERIINDAAAITVPTQLLISGSDWVVHHKPQHRFYELLGSSVKEKHVFEGFYHDTLGESRRKPAIDKIRQFILKNFSQPASISDLSNADKKGYTQEESRQLATPLSPYSLNNLYWIFTRLALKAGGYFSKGIRLGQETGFDSGSTLDFVYRNTPESTSAIGKLIDANYLNSVGWRGIRQRKTNIEALLHQASDTLCIKGKPVNILDIASGHGRYVLEAIEKMKNKADSILLRDYSDLSVQQGKELIKEKNLNDTTHFIKVNAFDASTYSQPERPVTLGIVSGLYELFSDNDLIRQSLQGFSSAIQTGGYLIYTNQPWHPQLEMIARTLTSHRNGQPWIMRRRTQTEMDQLVESAGFTKVEQRIDDDGIFTVSLAVRN